MVGSAQDELVRRAGQSLHLVGDQMSMLVGGTTDLAPPRWCGTAIATGDAGAPTPEEVAAVAVRVGATHVLPTDLASFVALGDAPPTIGGALRFPSPSAADIVAVHDKAHFHDLAVAHKIAVPRTVVAGGPDEVRSHGLRYPVLIKPVAGSASAGIHSCADRRELDARVDAGICYPVLVQQFVEGPDVDVSFVARDGQLLAWGVQEPCQPGGTGAVRFVDDDDVVAIARRFAAVTGYSGIAHLDCRRDRQRGGVVAFECNPRLYASILLAALAGANFVDIGLAAASGTLPSAPIVVRPGVVSTPRLIPRTLRSERGLGVMATRATWRGLALTVADPRELLPGRRRRLADAHNRPAPGFVRGVDETAADE